MTALTENQFNEIYGEFADCTIEQLETLKLDCPNETYWIDSIIQAKKEALGLNDLGTRWTGSARQTASFSCDLDRVPINSSNEENEIITVNRNTPGSPSSPDETFPPNRTAYASPVGLPEPASLELDGQDGRDISARVEGEIDPACVPIKADTDDTDPLDEIPFAYLKVDWFDNGKGSEENNRVKRINARHKINIQIRNRDDSPLNQFTAKICAENRYWKRSIDISKPFYKSIWEWYEDFCIQHSTADGHHFDHKPRLGHIYVRNGERIEDGVALFTKPEGQPAIVGLWLGEIHFTVALDDEKPKGQNKCQALQASYLWKPQPAVERTPLISLKDAFIQ